jgi:hypothetical protein
MSFFLTLPLSVLAMTGLRIFSRPRITGCLLWFRTQAPICHLVNPLQFLVDLLAESKWVERLAKLLQLRDPRGIRLHARQDSLPGSLCDVIDPAHLRAHPNFLHQLDACLP